MRHWIISTIIPKFFLLSVSILRHTTASPTNPGFQSLDDVLEEAEWTASEFCAECLFRGVVPHLAERRSPFPRGTDVPFPFPNFPDHPLSPADAAERCSTRVKGFIGEEIPWLLESVRGPNANHIRTVYHDYAQRLTCSVDDFDQNYGTDAHRPRFWPENQQWSRKRLAALDPDQRAYVEGLLRERRMRERQARNSGYYSSQWRSEMRAKIEGVRRTVQSVKPSAALASLSRSVVSSLSGAGPAWKAISASVASPKFKPPAVVVP